MWIKRGALLIMNSENVLLVWLELIGAYFTGLLFGRNAHVAVALSNNDNLILGNRKRRRLWLWQRLVSLICWYIYICFES